jgi:transposase-like protein
MAGSVRAGKRREWQQRLARFEQAQQSVAEFCRQEGVSAPSFYQWRKRLAERPQAAASFRPVRLVPAAGVTVQLPGGTQLEVPTSDRRALRLVLQTLARADARRAGGDGC